MNPTTKKFTHPAFLPTTTEMCIALEMLNTPAMRRHRIRNEIKRFLKAMKLVDLYRKDAETVKRRHSESIVKKIEQYIARHDGTDSRNDGNPKKKETSSS